MVPEKEKVTTSCSLGAWRFLVRGGLNRGSGCGYIWLRVVLVGLSGMPVKNLWLGGASDNLIGLCKEVRLAIK